MPNNQTATSLLSTAGANASAEGLQAQSQFNNLLKKNNN